MAQSNSFSVRRDSRTKACKCRTRHSRMNFVRASGVRLISLMTASVTCRSLSMIMGCTSLILTLSQQISENFILVANRGAGVSLALTQHGPAVVRAIEMQKSPAGRRRHQTPTNCSTKAWETDGCRALFRNPGDDQVQELERSAVRRLDRRAFGRSEIHAGAL